MKSSLIVILSALLLISCKSNSTNVIKGNGKVVSTEMRINDYSQLIVNGSCEVVYEQKTSSKPYLRYEIDQNLVDNVNIKVKGNKLIIGTRGSFSKVSKFKVYTNSSHLQEVKLTGSSYTTIKKTLNTSQLDIFISGSGRVKADKLKCNSVNVSLSGSGSTILNGETYYSQLKVSGSGEIDAFSLKAKNTICKVAGSGSAKIYVTDNLESRISGSGNIFCKGKPKRVDNKATGSGKLKME